jgi:hypothetical protein
MYISWRRECDLEESREPQAAMVSYQRKVLAAYRNGTLELSDERKRELTAQYGVTFNG